MKFCLSSVVIIDHSETNRPTRAPDQILAREIKHHQNGISVAKAQMSFMQNVPNGKGQRETTVFLRHASLGHNLPLLWSHLFVSVSLIVLFML